MRGAMRNLSGIPRLLLATSVIASPMPLIAATDTATVAAEIIRVINLTNRSGLAFGSIASGNVVGSVILSPEGTRLVTGGATIISSSATSGPASFDIDGEPNSTYAITLPNSVVLHETGGNSMTVDNFASLPLVTGLTDVGGQQELLVGATLNVGVNQAAGAYVGTMSVTISYN
jgi:hypothetical protein